MSIIYKPFYPDPIEGQAVLNNFTRTLRYHGQDALAEDLKRGIPLYETRTLENVGHPAAKDPDLLLRGTCLSACAYLQEQGRKVDLVYIDPPLRVVLTTLSKFICGVIQKLRRKLPLMSKVSHTIRMPHMLWRKKCMVISGIRKNT